jgi:non-specific serine/threonine protein kinase
VGAGPSNLPHPVTSFVGRERELATMRELVAAHRLVSLTGAGGVGKTRLALEAAGALRPAYPDGVWLAELAALADPALVPQAVATAVGVREEPGRPPAATLADALRPRRLLLVLDNCEHLLEACARLADALLRACPAVRILATSREPLGIAGEVPWPVPSLRLADLADGAPAPPAAALARSEAVRLFAARAAAARPGFAVTDHNAVAVARLCARLDGIPLALELAAARVRALSVDQLLARLEDRFRLLTGGSRTALERHQTLQEAVDWSHALLTAPERVLFRRLAVFAGGWTLEAAEAVCPDPDGRDGGVAREDVLDLLTRLVDQSLVVADAPEAGPTRYRLLETLRQYAQQKLVDAEEVAAVRGRHAAHSLALAEQAAPALYGPEQLAWLDRLEGEHANLLLALAWLAERGAHGEPEADAATEAALRLGAALTQFWVIRGHIPTAGEWLGRLLALPGAQRTAARARVLVCAAEIAEWRRDDPETLRLATEGLALAQAVGDPEGTAWAHAWLGVTAWRARDPAAARLHLTASRRAFAALGYPSLAALSVMALAEGDAATARARLTQAVTVLRDGGSVWSIPPDLRGLAQVAEVQGQPERAARLWGAVAAQHQALRGRSLPTAQDLHADSLEQTAASLRARLGDAAFDAAWAAGQAMSLEEAVADALAEDRSDG